MVAVFTGDLIASRRAGTAATDGSIAALERAALEMGRRQGFDPRFTRFRGDGWQMVLTSPNRTLFAAVSLLASLAAEGLGVETRLAIGIGLAETLGTSDLSDASGEAFVCSGKFLEDISGQEHLKLGGPATRLWQRAIVELVDWVAGNWTAQQAQALYIYLLGDHDNNRQRAESIGISRQAFDARLNGTGFRPVLTAIEAFHGWDFSRDTP